MTFTTAWAQSSVMPNVICWSFLNIYNCKIAKDLINDSTLTIANVTFFESFN